MNQQLMLEPRQLNSTDREILSFMVKHGRVSPSWVAEETNNPRAYVSQRLKRLKEHDHVNQPHRGLWDLIDDPRESGASQDGEA